MALTFADDLPLMSGGPLCAGNIVVIPNLGQAVPAQGATGQPLK
jgi:hypothetical protein